MSGSPLRVSVAMATYNGERWLPLQLRSILDELEPADELVVVDDASTDRTRALLAEIADPRVRVLHNARNLGVRATFERALGATAGDIVFLADQDDVWLPGKRQALVDAIAADARNVLAIGDAEIVDGDGARVAESFMRGRGGFRGSLFATLVKNRYLGCALAFRRELLARVLPIPEDVPMHDMWIGALAACTGRVVYVDRVLMAYRRHGDNASPSRRADVGTMLRWRWCLLKNVVLRLLRARAPAAEAVR